jgi:UDP-GlcNAc:undecaprenyl-phosphate/decaprenyl-phosphate GlcNAc-1-phosphate transferase
MTEWLLTIGISAYLITAILLTKLSMILASKLNITDSASSAPERKFQKKPIPLMGALGFTLLGLFSMGFAWLCLKFNLFNLMDYLQTGLFYPFRLYWVLFGALIIYIAGCLDDKYQLQAKYYSLLLFIGLFTAVFLGNLRIESFSYPFDNLNINIGLLPNILAFLWIGGCLASTKFLDGHDGLVATVGTISFFSIAASSMLPHINQPLLFIFGLIWALNCIAFLFFNFPEAKLYLGDGGSTIIGFMIGVFSILSGAKVATVGTVVGWFILDIFLVMLVRLIRSGGSLKGLTEGDSRMHWHHRLKNLGMNKIQVLSFTTILILSFAQMGMIRQTEYKIWLLLIQLVSLLVIFIVSFKDFTKKVPKNK